MRIRSTLSILALALTAACGDDVQEGLVIGALIDQTGSNSETSWVQAAQLAVRQVNEALDSEGSSMHFVLLPSDSENNPVKAQTRALDLVNGRDAKALMADTTQVTEAVGRLIYANQIDVAVQCSSCESRDFLNPAYVNPGDSQLQQVRNDPRGTLFRTSLSTDPMAYVAFDILRQLQGSLDRNNDGFIKLEFYGSDEAYGHAAVASLEDAAAVMFADYKSEIFADNKFAYERVFHAADAPTRVNYAADLTNLTNTNITDPPTPDTHSPDWIIMASYAGNAASFRETYVQFQNPSFPGLLFFPTFRQSNTLAQLGSGVNATQGLSMLVTADNDAGSVFAQDFQREYGFAPHFLDAAYYDNAVTLMLAAVIGGGANGTSDNVSAAAIRAALPSTSAAGGARAIPGVDGLRTAVRNIRAGAAINYDGASGPMDYDANGSVKNKLTRFTGVGGEFIDTGSKYDCIANSGPTCGVQPFVAP